MKVLVLGAHPEPSRFANKAMLLLERHGHTPVPINPRFDKVLGKICYPDVAQWAIQSGEKAETVTVYLNPAHSSKMQDALVALKPKRVIFNPGAENPALADTLKKISVDVWKTAL
jgi:predicted CoA-binding protein